MLTNSDRGGEVTAAVERAFLARFGVGEPELVPLELGADRLAEYAGHYRNERVEFLRERGELAWIRDGVRLYRRERD